MVHAQTGSGSWTVFELPRQVQVQAAEELAWGLHHGANAMLVSDLQER